MGRLGVTRRRRDFGGRQAVAEKLFANSATTPARGLTGGEISVAPQQYAAGNAAVPDAAAAAPTFGSGVADAGDIAPLTGMLSPTASGTTMGWPLSGMGANTIAGDFGFGNAAADAAVPTVATDLAAATPAVTGATDAAAAGNTGFSRVDPSFPAICRLRPLPRA